MVCSKVINTTGKDIPEYTARESMDMNSVEIQQILKKFHNQIGAFAIDENDDAMLDTVDKLFRSIAKYIIKITPEHQSEDSVLKRILEDEEDLVFIVLDLEPYVVKYVISILDMYLENSSGTNRSEIEVLLHKMVICVPVYIRVSTNGLNKMVSKMVSISVLNNI